MLFLVQYFNFVCSNIRGLVNDDFFISLNVCLNCKLCLNSTGTCEAGSTLRATLSTKKGYF